MYEEANDSFYFRVTARILYRPLSLSTSLYFLLTLACITLQIAALCSVSLTTWWWFATAEWFSGDDENISKLYPAGPSYPQNWVETMDFYDNKAFGVCIIVIVPLFLSAIMIGFSAASEIKELKAGRILIGPAMSAMIRMDFGLPKAALFGKIFMCCLIYYFRMSLSWYYFGIASQLLGNSDGPVNLLLNSMALVFVLEVDQNICIDMPHSNSFSWAKDKAKIESYIGTLKAARLVLRKAVKNFHGTSPIFTRGVTVLGWLCSIGVPGAVFLIGMGMQEHTTRGEFVTVDDDYPIGKNGGHQPGLTYVYNCSMYALLIVLLLDVHCSVHAAKSDSSSIRSILETLVLFCLDGAIVVLLYIVCIDWGLMLFFYQLSPKTDKLPNIWKTIDPNPKDPDPFTYYYGYYYDDAVNES